MSYDIINLDFFVSKKINLDFSFMSHRTYSDAYIYACTLTPMNTTVLHTHLEINEITTSFVIDGHVT